MKENWWESLVFKVLVLTVLAAGVTAFQSEKPLVKVLKNFASGILAGFCSFIICKAAGLSEVTILLVAGILAAFVSSLWPELESWAKRYTKKKADDSVHRD